MYINQRLLAFVVMLLAGSGAVVAAATAIVIFLRVLQGNLGLLALVPAGILALGAGIAFWLFGLSRERLRKKRS